jgi:hypothetical protein
MLAGMNTFGLEAANGIAPSVIPTNPIIPELVPNVLSSCVKCFPKNVTEKNAISGGIDIAACVAVPAIQFQSSGVEPGTCVDCNHNHVPNTSAVLLTGPPRSKQIIDETKAAINNALPATFSSNHASPSNIPITTGPNKGPNTQRDIRPVINNIPNGRINNPESPFNDDGHLIFLS